MLPPPHTPPPPALPNGNKFLLLQVVFVFWRNKALPHTLPSTRPLLCPEVISVLILSLFHKYFYTLARCVCIQNSIKIY